MGEHEPEKRAETRSLQFCAEFLRQGDRAAARRGLSSPGRLKRACVRVSTLADECVDALGKRYESCIRMIRHIQSFIRA